MRISDRYIGRQILAGTVFAIVLLSTIMVLGSLFQKIRMLLVDYGAPLSVIVEFMAGLMPFSLIYTIPWAFLSAVLLVFGRLSGDQELTGFRTAGMSLRRLSVPVFVLGATFSLLCLWLNVEVAPRAQAHAKGVLIRAFVKDPRSMLSAAASQNGLERFEKSAKGVRAYIEKSNTEGSQLTNLHLFRLADPDDPNDPGKDGSGNTGKSSKDGATASPQNKDKAAGTAKAATIPPMLARTDADGNPDPAAGNGDGNDNGDAPAGNQDVYIHAIFAETEADDVKREFRFHLHDSYFETTDDNDLPRIVVSGEARPVVVPYTIDDKGKIRPREMTNRELHQFMDSPAGQQLRNSPTRRDQMKWLDRFSEIQHRYASSFACLAFAFIGVPLGIKARRRDTSSGIMISIAIGAAYFSLGMFEASSQRSVILLAWLPNVICILLGLYLFRRAKFR